MGVVYEAEDTVLARTVAVKAIELAFEPTEEARSEFEQRFFTEARAAARLAHPGIVVCHDVGKDSGSGKLFIVFEYLKGRTLAELAAEGPMDWRSALAIVVRVARAIQHAHEHGVVHRDLKPANIMLLDAGTGGGSAARAEATVKIMDFGFARLESLGHRLTRTGQSFGTPLYMSPEQALGQRSDTRSDIFSMGSVLCTLLLGRPWFEAPSLPQIVRRLVHDDPPHLAILRPDLPASLDAVLGMALAKSAEDRYASAADMADDLEDILAGRSASHALLAGPASAAREPGSPPPPDLLEAFLEELPLLESASNPGAKAAGSVTQTVPARASRPVTGGSGRRWLLPATAVAVWAVLAVVVNRALAPSVAHDFHDPGPGRTHDDGSDDTDDHGADDTDDHGSGGGSDRPVAGSGHHDARPRVAAGDGIQSACRRGPHLFDGRRAEPDPAERRAPVRERPAHHLDRRRARVRDEAPGPRLQEGCLQGARGPGRKDARPRAGPA
jgi:serine/threonine-protein kinase